MHNSGLKMDTWSAKSGYARSFQLAVVTAQTGLDLLVNVVPTLEGLHRANLDCTFADKISFHRTHKPGTQCAETRAI